ncbi:MAG TPA: type VI secretion system accessory protein TagJ [Steroidobacteraceae bacterium]|jgi:type VI secretion system protein ImpE
MTTNPDTAARFDAGDLEGAIGLVTESVRRRPTDAMARAELAELLCFTGDLERADKHLDLAQQQDPSVAMGVSLFRQLIRAEEARQQFYSECRLPEFIDSPTSEDQLYLRAAVALRNGDETGAARLLEDAEGSRTHRGGTIDGEAFDDLRDLDDLSAAHFDVLTSTGKFFWIPMRRVDSVHLHKPERRRDLIWRRATLEVAQGPSGEVFIAAMYPSGNGEVSPALRLGRETDFVGGEGRPVRGRGLRSFLVGEEARPILDIEHIEFTRA